MSAALEGDIPGASTAPQAHEPGLSAAPPAHRLGLVADTHGWLDPALATHFAGVERILHAGDLGIYGNCVVVDHGLGVQSLYAHLSQIGVKVGDTVKKDQEIGRTGSTGLAGGDHLHFTMLVQGVPVNPVEWWDAHWLQDRVLRKITEAGGQLR